MADPDSPAAGEPADEATLRGQIADLTRQLVAERAAANARIVAAEVKAAAVKMGAHEPSDLLKLIDISKLAIGEDGEVKGVDDLLTAVKAVKPWAFSGPSRSGEKPGATTTSTATPPNTSPGSKRLRDLPAAERKAELRKFGIHV
jgi:hypothetical protein